MPVDPPRFSSDLAHLVRERHPATSAAALRETAEYLADRYAEIGLAVSRHRFSAAAGTFENVVGTLTSPMTTGPALIVGAHYDTVAGSPGADDNASGLAVLLDVAGRLRGAPLTRPVRFVAFGLEEQDLLGSRAYAADLATAREPIAGALVLECVGYASRKAGSQAMPPGVPIAVPTVGDFLGVIGNQRSVSFMGALTRAMERHVPVVPLVVPGNGEALPDTRRSDHTAFWEQNIPAVMVTDTANFRNPHYHRPTDRLETLDLVFMGAVADAVTAAVAAWAIAPETA